jgi:hypothetical protein
MVTFLVGSPEEWLVLGLQTVGFGPSRQNCCDKTNMERFLAHFEASPKTCCAVFSNLQTTQVKAAMIAKPFIVYFLMTMFWLKTYPSESLTAGTFNVNENNTAWTQVWKYVLAIQGLKAQKVNVS